MISSTPSIEDFNPLPQQLDIIRYVRLGDYSHGTKEILLSGSVGSAKSLTLAHLVVTHCLMFRGAKAGIGRLALPQLKATLCQRIREHLYGLQVDYSYNQSSGSFKIHDSIIKAVSWSDANFTKLGSMEFSCFAIEELTESKTSDAYDTILERVNRVPHIKEPFLVSATNPDSPAHWAYKKLIESPDVKVFYSNTYDNPYLPRAYIEKLKSRLDPKMAQRKIYGQWIEINQEVIYYAYDREHNFVDKSYKIDRRYPIRLSYDFNIGEGKPLSAIFGQYLADKDEWHWFDQVIVEGQRTRDSLEEAASRGLLDHGLEIRVHGDVSGSSRDTRGTQSDYEIIEKFLANYQTKRGERLRFRIDLPRSNPRIRERHNLVNAYFLNDLGKRRCFVYKDCPTLDEGFRLTKLKAGASYLEQDSDRFQHCTTAAGYAMMYVDQMKGYESSSSGTIGGF